MTSTVYSFNPKKMVNELFGSRKLILKNPLGIERIKLAYVNKISCNPVKNISCKPVKNILFVRLVMGIVQLKFPTRFGMDLINNTLFQMSNGVFIYKFN